MSRIYDDTICKLGEGPLWHPRRKQFYWFDIIGHRLLTREDGKTRIVQFDEHVSAAGWVSEDDLLIASETKLFLFDVDNETSRDVLPLEADNRVTRSNDGRADPWGGFWIGTMGKGAEPGAGAIYRFYRGEIKTLYPGITIPNAICFSPDKSTAYWADTKVGKLMKQALEPKHGWPTGDAEVLVDHSAHHGQKRLIFMTELPFPAQQTSCPAFGGAELQTLYVTSALNGLEQTGYEGKTYATETDTIGQAEHRVIL